MPASRWEPLTRVKRTKSATTSSSRARPIRMTPEPKLDIPVSDIRAEVALARPG